MPPATVKPALVVLQETITGIKHAFADAPNSLHEADAPAFLNLEGPVEYDWQIYGRETVQEKRNYRMILYIGMRGSGLPGEVSRKATPLFSAVMLMFAAHPQLGGVKGVQEALITGDGGLVGIKFQEDDWIGIEFTLHVVEAVPYTFAELE
jgi:hypothetical protein